MNSERRAPARRLAATGLLLALAAPALLAATPADSLVLAWNLDSISTFDPAQMGEVVGNEVVANLCDTLVSPAVDDATEVRPALAERWSFSADGKTLTFELRPDLRFADGRAATAADLAWSIHRGMRLERNAAAALKEYGFSAEDIERQVRAQGERGVVLELDQPYPPSVILQAIAAHRLSSLLDRQTLLQHEVNGDLGNRYLAGNSACVGPYGLRHWNAGEVAVLEANPQYWAPPPLKRVIIRHVAESASQRLLLEKGDVDVARNLNAEDLAALEKRPNIRIESVARPQMYFLDINNAHPAFGDPGVRLALRHLFDYRGLADSVMRYTGSPRASFVPLGSFGALDADEALPFRLDLDEARRLLAEAGYPDGFDATLLYGTPQYSAPIAQALQRNAAQVGIRLKLERMTNAQLFTRITARQYELSLHSLESNIPDAHGMATRLVYNESPTPRQARGALPTVFATYYSEQANREVRAALLEADPQRRAERYRALQRQQMREGPFAFLFQLNNVAALGSQVGVWRWNGQRSYFAEARK